MSALKNYLEALQPGIDIVADAAGLSESALVQLGAPDAVARDLAGLSEVYFGDTAFTRRQREAVAGARLVRHSLPALLVIEKYASRARSQRDAWALRHELCHTDADVRALARLAARKLRELNPPLPPREGVRLTRRRTGPWTLSLTGNSADVADIHAAIRTETIAAAEAKLQEELASLSTPQDTAPADNPQTQPQPAAPSTPVEPTFAAAARLVLGQSSAAQTVIRTNVIIKLNELVQIAEGDGDDIELRMTNGARITGAQLVGRALEDHGFVTLVHPVKGPVNLYRTKRLATWKQRMMAWAESPVCPWYECNCPAEEAQVHHIVPWSQGGETNSKNLVVACPYHNGVNDDEYREDGIGKPKRGKLARIDGRIAWLPPWAGPPIFADD